MKKQQKKHWYYKIVDICPICLGEDAFKVRKYSKKPKNSNKLRETNQIAHDSCYSNL